MNTVRYFVAIVSGIIISAGVSFAQSNNSELEIITLKQKLLEKEIEQIKQQQSALKQSDSIRQIYQRLIELENSVSNLSYTKPLTNDTIEYNIYKNSFGFEFFRFFSGSMGLNYERAVNKKGALHIGLIGTYIKENGMGDSYLKDASYTDSYDGYTMNYEADEMYGLGIELKYKHYLFGGSRIHADDDVFRGLYFAPSAMYRKLYYNGTKYSRVDMIDEMVQKKWHQQLDIGRIGVFVGNNLVVYNTFIIDIYMGGALRFCETLKSNDYSNGFFDADYNGIMPLVGLNFGFTSR